MADFNYTGGVRFAPDKVVDVTADKDGNPTKACNPITGVCLEGGGGDFSTATLTIEATSNDALAEDVFAMYYNELLDGYIAGSVTDETAQIVVPVMLDAGEGAYGETSGSIVYNADKGVYIITGNCKVQIYSGGPT